MLEVETSSRGSRAVACVAKGTWTRRAPRLSVEHLPCALASRASSIPAGVATSADALPATTRRPVALRGGDPFHQPSNHQAKQEVATTNVTAIKVPGFVAGTWEIDPVHSEVSFVVRHLVVSKVRGRFERFSGTIVTDKVLDRSSSSQKG